MRTTTHLRGRFLPLLLALGLFAAACSTGSDDATSPDDGPAGTDNSDDADSADADVIDSDDSGSADGDETDANVDTDNTPRTASFRGVTEDAIDIGVGFWDTSAFGFGFFGDVDDVWGALTDAVNANGGVNGRDLQATVAGFNPADNEGMLAACIALTEDAKVFAVLGGMRGDASFCVFEQHETIHLGSQVGAAGEALDRARAPIAGFEIAGTARETTFIAELDAMGWFDGASSVGVHYDGSTTADRVETAVEAALNDLGIELDLALNIDDLVLDSDTIEGQTDIMRQQARDAGLDRIIIFGAAATGYVTYGELDVPLASVGSSNFTTAVNSGIDPADLDGTIATTTRVNLATDGIDAKTQECLDVVSAALPDARFDRPGPGVTNGGDDPNYWNYTVLACRDLDLFIQAATAAGVELTNDTFLVGLESLTDTSLPQIPFVSFGPGKYNGGDTIRLVEFDADADEDGELIALGDPVDLTP